MRGLDQLTLLVLSPHPISYTILDDPPLHHVPPIMPASASGHSLLAFSPRPEPSRPSRSLVGERPSLGRFLCMSQLVPPTVISRGEYLPLTRFRFVF